MSEPRRAGWTTRPWYLFACAGGYVVIALVWFVLGVNAHDEVQMGLATLWIGLAVFWTVRAVRRLRTGAGQNY